MSIKGNNTDSWENQRNKFYYDVLESSVNYKDLYEYNKIDPNFNFLESLFFEPVTAFFDLISDKNLPKDEFFKVIDKCQYSILRVLNACIVRDFDGLPLFILKDFTCCLYLEHCWRSYMYELAEGQPNCIKKYREYLKVVYYLAVTSQKFLLFPLQKSFSFDQSFFTTPDSFQHYCLTIRDCSEALLHFEHEFGLIALNKLLPFVFVLMMNEFGSYNPVDPLEPIIQRIYAKKKSNKTLKKVNRGSEVTKWYFLDSMDQISGPFYSDYMEYLYYNGYFNYNSYISNSKKSYFVPLHSIYTFVSGKAPLLFTEPNFAFYGRQHNCFNLSSPIKKEYLIFLTKMEKIIFDFAKSGSSKFSAPLRESCPEKLNAKVMTHFFGNQKTDDFEDPPNNLENKQLKSSTLELQNNMLHLVSEREVNTATNNNSNTEVNKVQVDVNEHCFITNAKKNEEKGKINTNNNLFHHFADQDVIADKETTNNVSVNSDKFTTKSKVDASKNEFISSDFQAAQNKSDSGGWKTSQKSKSNEEKTFSKIDKMTKASGTKLGLYKVTADTKTNFLNYSVDIATPNDTKNNHLFVQKEVHDLNFGKTENKFSAIAEQSTNKTISKHAKEENRAPRGLICSVSQVVKRTIVEDRSTVLKSSSASLDLNHEPCLLDTCNIITNKNPKTANAGKAAQSSTIFKSGKWSEIIGSQKDAPPLDSDIMFKKNQNSRNVVESSDDSVKFYPSITFSVVTKNKF